MNAQRKILMFDGDCKLCDRLVNFVMRHDSCGRILFAPLQSDRGKSLLEESGLSENYFKSVVYLRDNKHFIRSSAVLNVLKDLRGGWSLLYGFIIVPKFICDLIYSMIAGIRYRIFGRRFFCSIPFAGCLKTDI
jgi:predicted DCC family thiol-disulfide oxidoreductase YuxK